MGAERLSRAALLLAVLVVAASGCQPEPDSEPEPSAAGETGVVARVGDGDSLTLRDGRKLRLLQVDAPELAQDCYGRAALRELSALAGPGTRVRLVRDPRLDASDRYGRPLRYVFVGARNVNVELVRRGAASPYFFRNHRGRYADVLLAAVDAARARRAGYWGACPGAELNTGLGSLTGPA